MTTQQSCYRHLALLVAALGVAGLLSGRRPYTPAPLPSAAAAPVGRHAPVQASITQLPLSFERAPEPARARHEFCARGMGYALSLSATEARFTLADAQPRPAGAHRLAAGPAAPTAVVRMELEGANRAAVAAALSPLPGKAHYFLGNDPRRWRAEVPAYARIRYAAVYPGVDVVYYGNQQQLEYDFIVAPGSDPRRIALRFDGVETIEVAPDGDLVLRTAVGPVRQQRPRIYQERGRRRQAIAGRYVLKGGRRVGFQVGPYDASRPLVIDPVVVYARCLGGAAGDSAADIALDGFGNVYVTGLTYSHDFPTTPDTYDSVGKTSRPNDIPVAFVTKLSPGGDLVYSTYLGGTNGDAGFAVAVDEDGSAYVTGVTNSSDFPTTAGAFERRQRHGFVTKLTPAGSGLVYSTYLCGSSNFDFGYGIAVDRFGCAYVTGQTASEDFPLERPFQPRPGRGAADAFVTKLNAAGSALVYSSFLGGSNKDVAFGIVVDEASSAYLAGFTDSSNFPTTSEAYQKAAPRGLSDVFVTKLDAEGTGFLYSTLLGGSRSDYGFGLALDEAGLVYVTGRTYSRDLPTKNAFDSVLDGSSDAFVAKLDPTASGEASLVYSTFLGGSGDETGRGVAVDPMSNAYVTGTTSSNDFPTKDAFDTTLNGNTDAFITKLSPAGSALVYSTYLGGSGDEGGGDRSGDVAVDRAGHVYVTGVTSSRDLSTGPGTLQPLCNGSGDAFLVKMGDESIPPVTLVAVEVVPAAVLGCNPAVGTVFLSGKAPSGGAVVKLGLIDSNGTSPAASVPINVTVPEGLDRHQFTVTTNTVPATQKVTISGTYDDNTRSAPLEVQPITVQSLRIEPSVVPGCRPATGFVAISHPAPACGVEIDLVCSDPATTRAGAAPAATVPPRLTVPRGETTASFTITPVAVYYARQVEVTASAGGVTQSAPLTVRPTGIQSFRVDPPEVEGGTSTWGIVSLECPAGPGPITITLTSHRWNVAAVPMVITIEQGKDRSEPFRIDTSTVYESAVVKLTASANGTSKDAFLTVHPAPPCSGMPLPYGVTTCNSLLIPGENHTYSFTANQGDVILLRISRRSRDLWPSLQLRDPRGNVLLSSTPAVSITLTKALPFTGTYCIQVSAGTAGTPTGEYCLYLQRLNQPGNARVLSLGEAVHDAVSMPAEMNTYTFTGSKDDVVLLRAARGERGQLAPLLLLYGPDGDLVSQVGGPDSVETMPLPLLPSTGVYTLLVGDRWTGTLTGDYYLYVQIPNRPVKARSISLGQVVFGNIGVPAQMDTYTLATDTDDAVALQISRTSDRVQPLVRVYDSHGNLVGKAMGDSSGNAELRLALPGAGVYTVMVGDGSDRRQTGGYELRLDPTTSSVLGTNH